MNSFLSFIVVVFVLFGSFVLIRYFNVQEQKNAPSFYVDYVVDGDTFITGDKRVRIWGINAPEVNEPYFETSRLYLESLIKDNVVKCVWRNNDRYKREAMRCKLGEDDIGQMMVLEGMAKDLSGYSNGFYQRDEKHARDHKKGIWKDWSG